MADFPTEGDDTITGTTDWDAIDGLGGNDTILGLDGNDVLTGSAGDDMLSGGAGDDRLSGGDGDNTLSGGDGDDYLSSNSGAQNFDGGTGNDTIGHIISLASTLAGGDGEDRLLAFTLHDSTCYFIVDTYEGDADDGQLSLITGFEHYEVHGAAGNDIIATGNGDDYVYSAAGDDTIEGHDGHDLLVGDAGNDEISGGAGNDDIMAGSGEDTIDGGEGNDTIHGGDHNDLIEGGAGDDRLFGDSMVDTIRGDDGDDFITFGELLSGSIGEGHGGAGDDWLRVFGTNATTLRGDAGTDLVDIIWALGPVTDHATIDLTAGIASSAGGHALDFDGFERLRTQLGNSDDTVTGGDFDDDIGAGGGANRISGGGGDDRITITMATDAATPDEIRHSQVYGGAGNDHLLIYMGEGAWDRLILDADGSSDGLGGRPLIDGVESVEVVGTNDGATVSLLGTGHNTIYGGDGADTFTTGTGNDSLYGGEGIDTLRGGGGGDALTGGVGADELTGDAGRDFLNGGWGSRDRLWGGAGNDSFYHLGHSGHGTDWVQDYSSAEGDRLLYGDPAANFADFGVIFAASASPDPLNSGAAGVDEAFVVNRATGQILWVLVDGAANEHIWLRIGDEITDLLA